MSSLERMPEVTTRRSQAWSIKGPEWQQMSCPIHTSGVTKRIQAWARCQEWTPNRWQTRTTTREITSRTSSTKINGCPITQPRWSEEGVCHSSWLYWSNLLHKRVFSLFHVLRVWFMYLWPECIVKTTESIAETSDSSTGSKVLLSWKLRGHTGRTLLRISGKKPDQCIAVCWTENMS